MLAWTTAIVPGSRGELVFRAELGADERRAAFDLRAAAFQKRSDYLIGAHPGRHPAEDPHDACGHQFLCLLRDEPVAAVRFGSALHGRFEAEELAPLPNSLAEMRDALFQGSRMVVREDQRKNQVSETIFHLACRWLSEHTPIRWYFGLCLPKLAQFYEHFGAQTLSRQPIVVPQRNGQEYLWVRGELAHSAETVRHYLASIPGAWDVARCRFPR